MTLEMSELASHTNTLRRQQNSMSDGRNNFKNKERGNITRPPIIKAQSFSPHVPNPSDHDDNPLNHHDHTKAHAEAVAYEAKLYMTYLSIFVVVDFVLIICHLGIDWISDLAFILILLKATYADLAHGPRCDKIHTVKEKICFLTKVLIFLFVAVFAFGCITDQFALELPLDLQVMDTDGSVTEETLQVWTWAYKGFSMVRFSDMTGASGSPNNGPNVLGGDIEYNATGLNVGIHIVVCASKLAVARFLLLEWELTIKSISRFIRTL